MDIPQEWALEDGGKALVRRLCVQRLQRGIGILTRVALYAEKPIITPSSQSVWTKVASD